MNNRMGSRPSKEELERELERETARVNAESRVTVYADLLWHARQFILDVKDEYVCMSCGARADKNCTDECLIKQAERALSADAYEIAVMLYKMTEEDKEHDTE